MSTEIYNVTELIGNQAECAPAVAELASVIQRTIKPESWFQMGGLWTVRGFFNPVVLRWYLVVFSEVPKTDMQSFLDSLKG
jgi:hypothetical protein